MTVRGVESYAQRLRIRLRLWLGEYVLNRNIGVPYQRLFGTKASASRPGGPSELELTLRQCVTSSPGVASLDFFTLSVTPDRHAVCSLAARSIENEPIVLDAFQIGAA